jgi:hypothetical protein
VLERDIQGLHSPAGDTHSNCHTLKCLPRWWRALLWDRVSVVIASLPKTPRRLWELGNQFFRLVEVTLYLYLCISVSLYLYADNLPFMDECMAKRISTSVLWMCGLTLLAASSTPMTPKDRRIPAKYKSGGCPEILRNFDNVEPMTRSRTAVLWSSTLSQRPGTGAFSPARLLSW